MGTRKVQGPIHFSLDFTTRRPRVPTITTITHTTMP